MQPTTESTIRLQPHGFPHVIDLRVTIDIRGPLQQLGQNIRPDAVLSIPAVQDAIAQSVGPAVSLDLRTLAELYDQYLSQRDIDNRISEKTRRENRRNCEKFEAWYRERNLGCTESLEALRQHDVLKLYAEHLRSKQTGSSASMCLKSIVSVRKLASELVRVGLLAVAPAGVTKSKINLLKPRSEQQRRLKAVPVTVDELNQMLSVLHECRWPRLGDVSPAHFWKTNLISHFVYGFRSQDWFSARSGVKQGLLWSGVIDSPQCPIVEDLENPAGWCYYLVHKTSAKDEAAERPSDVFVPLSTHIRSMLEPFRGLHPERVFPMRNNSRNYSLEFAKILERAGLSDAARKKELKPIIRLSLGRRDVASFRKSCSALWAKTVGRAASSYMLHHAVSEEGVAKITAEHYLQDHEVLRGITAAIEHLPLWKQIGEHHG